MFNHAIVMTSDTVSSGENKDSCIGTIQRILKGPHYWCVYESILPGGKDRLKEELIHLADQGKANLVITPGGTGLAPRDATPDVTLEVIRRQAPGVSMAMLLASKEKTPMWTLSRAVAGVRNQTLIINLPGSPKTVGKCLTAILQTLFHGLEIINNIAKQH